ncbi:hypothetical protein FKM82_008256 [Ascaphus truei]
MKRMTEGFTEEVVDAANLYFESYINEGLTENDMANAERLLEPFVDRDSGATIESWVDGDNSCSTYDHMTDSEIIQKDTSENQDLDATEETRNQSCHLRPCV